MLENFESNQYTAIKDIFIDDGGDCSDYVNLDKSAMAYRKICSALEKPLKIILFYGAPGSGKTFLLHKIHADIAGKWPVIFLPQPFFTEVDFIRVICEYFNIAPLDNIDELLFYCKSTIEIDAEKGLPSQQIILMLDESQLYPQNLIEKIRLMADTRYFKILFTLHKTEKEDIMAKEYFKTRIWESIELKSCSLDEVCMYIEKKLSYHGFGSFFLNFNKNNLESLCRFSKGNLRVLNKLLYKAFELLEYYEEHSPSKNSNKQNISKAIEMAAIDTGLLSA